MPRRPLTTTVALAAIVIAAGACDDGSLGTSQPTVPFVPQPEATDPPFTTVGEISPEVVAARVHRIVIETLGVTLTVADDECIDQALIDDVDPDALTQLGLDGVISEQPIPVQNQIFGAFDRCVSPEHYADVLAPVLEIAGADEEGARCVFETMRATLGFAGMFKVAAPDTGEVDRDDTLTQAVSDIYERCDVDPSELSPPTTPPPPPTTASATTSSATATSAGSGTTGTTGTAASSPASTASTTLAP
jgi:hypothetical protein